MTRSLMRLLAVVLVALALVAGGTTSPAGAAGAAAQRDAVTSPSAACQSQYGRFTASAASYNARTQQVRRAEKRVRAKQARVDRASTPKQKRKATKKLHKAERAQRRQVAQQDRLKKVAVADYNAWQDCEADAGAPASPIQALCDQGLPQAVCDAFTSLPLPGGTTTGGPLQPLCDAGAPQALCDAATLPSPDGASPLQPLCDLGLPAELCAASVPGAPGLPDVPGVPGVPGLPGPVCTLLPALCP